MTSQLVHPAQGLAKQRQRDLIARARQQQPEAGVCSVGQADRRARRETAANLSLIHI